MPSGSYLAEGLVMISTRSMELAGSCWRKAAPATPASPEGRPSMRICTLEEPRKKTLPSMSTVTEGTLVRSSWALAPVWVRSLPTLNTRRSIFISNVLCCSITTASSRLRMAGSRAMSPRRTGGPGL